MKTEQQIKEHLESLKRQKRDYDRIVKQAIKEGVSHSAIHAAFNADVLGKRIEEIVWTLEDSP
jgi:hypothetical protein